MLQECRASPRACCLSHLPFAESGSLAVTPDDCCADPSPPSHSTFKLPPFGIAPPSPHPDTIAHSPSH